MSGPAQRNLTLTEELEKLEQSITLTLQEIDSNFSRAHRIVTTSILPIVEQYAEHSKDVWEGAKFWKQFFESSANVSLSGYEEQPNEDTEHEQTVTEESTTDATQTSLAEDASYETPSSEHVDLGQHNPELDFSSLTISPSHSTPRPAAHHRKGKAPVSPFSEAYPSPYNPRGQEGIGIEEDVSTLPDNTPVTPGRQYASKYQLDQSTNPTSSPFIPPPSHKSAAKWANNNQRPTDPVLHHVLDKTYRVQATPLSNKYKPTKFAVSTPNDKPASRYVFDDSPISSPEMEAPKLHEEMFSSPIKGMSTPGTSRRTRQRNSPEKRGTPKPGISVLTPGKSKAKKTGWDSDENDFGAFDDETDAFGISPPKTMQFHIPHSRLMKTPAKEASKRIVSDLLATAGGTGTTIDDLTGDYGRYTQAEEEHSPTVVRSGARLEDETF